LLDSGKIKKGILFFYATLQKDENWAPYLIGYFKELQIYDCRGKSKKEILKLGNLGFSNNAHLKRLDPSVDFLIKGGADSRMLKRAFKLAEGLGHERIADELKEIVLTASGKKVKTGAPWYRWTLICHEAERLLDLIRRDDVKIYSYVVKDDTGFAPNPFWGYCTLATCKDRVRLGAQKDDWVIGTGSKENVGNDRLIYAMQVTEKLTFDEYFKDRRFRRKIPSGNEGFRRLGDNIYCGEVQRAPSAHSRENLSEENWRKTVEKDLRGKYVLVSEKGHFYYYGKNARPIPKHLLYIKKKGPNYKRKFDQEQVESFLSWLKEDTRAEIKGEPSNYGEAEQKLARVKKKGCIRGVTKYHRISDQDSKHSQC